MTTIYEIGPLRLDPEARVLTRDGTPVPLGARAVGVLTTLIEHANEYVPKSRIIDAAWPGVVVEESNLAVQIAAIRRVLAQAGGVCRIETLARRGYRFVGPLKALRERGIPEGAKASARSNLPATLTSFIGRERELVEIKRLLPSKRLLTIVGAGGIGKTRVALRRARKSSTRTATASGSRSWDRYRIRRWCRHRSPGHSKCRKGQERPSTSR